MYKSNLSMSEMDKGIKKFMSSMGLKIEIEDTNYTDYKYFFHQKYGTIRTLSYRVSVINKEDQVVYFVHVNWGVIDGKLKVYNMESYDMKNFSITNPFAYLGIDDKLVNQYLAEKTRGMAEEWIKTFPERK